MPAARRSLPTHLTNRPFSVHEAAAAGIPRSRLRRDDLTRPFTAVRAIDSPDSIRALCAGYLPKMADAEFFSHSTAAALHGIWLPFGFAAEGRVHVSVRRPARAPRDRRVVGHHLYDRMGLVWSVDGMRVASPIETWCQLATQLTLHDLVIAGHSLLQKGAGNPKLTAERMRAAVYAGSRPNRQQLERALPELRAGVRSAGEAEVLLLLRAEGLPEPEVNALIRVSDGTIYEGDAVYRDAKVVLEYEGDGHRVDRTTWRGDILRYERMKDDDWRVIRVTADDVGPRRAEFATRVRRAIT